MKEKGSEVSKKSVCVVTHGPMIRRSDVSFSADVGRQIFCVRVAGMAISLPLGDVAGVINEAVKNALRKEDKPNERIS